MALGDFYVLIALIKLATTGTGSIKHGYRDALRSLILRVCWRSLLQGQ
jgi:hypothetical protein